MTRMLSAAIVLVMAECLTACGGAAPGEPAPSETSAATEFLPAHTPSAPHSTPVPVPRGSPLDEAEQARAAPQVPVGDYEFVDFSGDRRWQMRPEPGTVTFDTPSGNTTCSWQLADAREVVCDITERSTPPVSRPANCGEYLSWATNYVSLSEFSARDGRCTGGIAAPYRGRMLPYGHALSAGPFGCVSEESGVTCVHFASGRGFMLSREQFRRF